MYRKDKLSAEFVRELESALGEHISLAAQAVLDALGRVVADMLGDSLSGVPVPERIPSIRAAFDAARDALDATLVKALEGDEAVQRAWAGADDWLVQATTPGDVGRVDDVDAVQETEDNWARLADVHEPAPTAPPERKGYTPVDWAAEFAAGAADEHGSSAPTEPGDLPRTKAGHIDWGAVFGAPDAPADKDITPHLVFKQVDSLADLQEGLIDWPATLAAWRVRSTTLGGAVAEQQAHVRTTRLRNLSDVFKQVVDNIVNDPTLQADEMVQAAQRVARELPAYVEQLNKQRVGAMGAQRVGTHAKPAQHGRNGHRRARGK